MKQGRPGFSTAKVLPLIVVCAVLAMVGAMTGCGVRVAPVVNAATSASTATQSAGSGSTTAAPPPVAPAPAPTPAPNPAPSPVGSNGFATVINFGDSITCGYYASPNNGSGYMYSMSGYATLLDTAVDASTKYLCRGGDMAADMARLWVYPNTDPELEKGQLYTALIGTNDAHFCGVLGGCIANWASALSASLAWLALPGADKVLGAAMLVDGHGWSAETTSGLEFGAATTTNGVTLSFEVQQAVAGRSLYVAYRVFDAAVKNGGTAVVSVDGVPTATLSATVATGHAIASQNGTTDTVFLAALPLGAVGKHAVTITMTGADGTFFSVLWAGASTQSYASVSGAPMVVVGSITATGQDSLNQSVAQYNAALTPLVAALVADGMNIAMAPTGSALDTSTDMSDLLHPNNAGHAKLAAAFASVLPKVAN